MLPIAVLPFCTAQTGASPTKREPGEARDRRGAVTEKREATEERAATEKAVTTEKRAETA